MIYDLDNEKYSFEFSIDSTYTIGSADNPFKYDKLFNPHNFGQNDHYKVLSIKVSDGIGETRLAVIGDFFTYDWKCAVLNGDILTVLQNKYLLFINLTDFSLKEIKPIGFDLNYEIHPCKYGYLIYGEMQILLLDFDFNIKWNFSGFDIFVTNSEHIPFDFDDEKIMLYDFLDNYYELDYNGNLVKESHSEI